MKYKCKKCGTEFKPRMFSGDCPKCGNPDVEVIYEYKHPSTTVTSPQE